jgi:hypothetical protein
MLAAALMAVLRLPLLLVVRGWRLQEAPAAVFVGAWAWAVACCQRLQLQLQWLPLRVAAAHGCCTRSVPAEQPAATGLEARCWVRPCVDQRRRSRRMQQRQQRQHRLGRVSCLDGWTARACLRLLLPGLVAPPMLLALMLVLALML